MSLKYPLLMAALAALLLTGCGAARIVAPAAPDLPPPQLEVERQPQAEPANQGQPATDVPELTAEAVQPAPAARWPDGEARTDEQGQVVVAVAPRNLNNPGETLDFDLGMNTHSVTLDMDLAALSTLTTDTGHVVGGLLWDAPRGGHHVSGILSFPAALDGAPLLEGAAVLTLTIRDVDAPERVFAWSSSHE